MTKRALVGLWALFFAAGLMVILAFSGAGRGTPDLGSALDLDRAGLSAPAGGTIASPFPIARPPHIESVPAPPKTAPGTEAARPRETQKASTPAPPTARATRSAPAPQTPRTPTARPQADDDANDDRGTQGGGRDDRDDDRDDRGGDRDDRDDDRDDRDRGGDDDRGDDDRGDD